MSIENKINKQEIPKEVLNIMNLLQDAGFEAYLIGGCVRDLLLGRIPKDWDITTNAMPEQIQSLFPKDKTFYENDFGTVGVKVEKNKLFKQYKQTLKFDPEETDIIEITPYRTEGKYSNARHPDEIQFSDNISDDLKRRDFTVNALAFDPINANFIDEYNGTEDLQRRLIKAVGNPRERFSEDALRMMRAIRLSAELGFTIESETLSAIAENANLLEKISKERIRDEFFKIVMSDNPLQAFAIIEKLGLLKWVLPELQEGVGCFQGGAHKFDVFEHLLRSLQHSATKKYPLEVRLAALLHDVGKPRSKREGSKKPTFYGHEVIGAKMVREIAKNLRFPKELAQKVEKLVRWHMFFADPDKITLSAARRMIARVGEDDIWDLLNLRICDRIGTGRPKEQPFRFRKYKSMIEEALRDPVSLKQLKIDGNQIMKILNEKPSARIGWILYALFDEVLSDPKKNDVEYLRERVLELKELDDNELKTLGEAGKTAMQDEDLKEVKKLRKKHNVL